MKTKLLIVLSIILSLIQPIHATTDIVVGYINDNSMIQKPYTSGYEGLGFDLFTTFEQYNDNRYVYNEISYTEINTLLLNNKIHLFGPVYNNEEKDYLYTDEMGYCDLYISTFNEKSILSNDSIIYRMNDDKLDTILRQYLEENQFQCVIKDLEDFSDKNGFYLTTTLQQIDELYLYEKIETIPFYFKSNLNHKTIIDDINYALQQIQIDYLYFYEKLYLKYVQNENILYPISSQELELLQDKEYRVGFSNSYVPVSYLDDNNEPKGIAIDLIEYIKNKYNLNIQYEVFDDQEIMWDLSVSVINDHTRNNQYLQNFTYHQFPLFIVKKQNQSINQDAVVGLFDYQGYDLALLEEGFTIDNYKTFDNIDDLANALYTNSVDYIVSSSLSTDLLLKDPRASKYSIEPLNYNLHLPVVFNDHLTSMEINLFKKLFESIPTHTINTFITNNSQNYELTPTVQGFIKQYTTPIILFSCLFIFIIALFISYIFYNKQLIYKKALHQDPLTKGYTKYKFVEEVDKILMNNEYDDALIISLKLHQFKYLSELYGYYYSNEIIKEYYTLICTVFNDTSCIARIIEDEFIVLTRKCYFDKIDINLLNVFQCLDKEKIIYSSIGVFLVEHGLSDIQFMIDNAINARNQNTIIHKNQITYYTEMVKLEQSKKERMVSKMEKALFNKEFKLYFQPKMNIHTNKIVGSEVLVRWHSLTDQIILPSEFIPVFEENQFIIDLDFFVMEETLKILSNKYIDHVVSINISGHTFNTENFIERVMRLFNQYPISSSKIEFELTESIMIDQLEIKKGKMKVLQSLGIILSIDDFGSGNSSLGRLSEIDVDVVKIDRAFIKDITTKEKAFTVLKAMIKLVHHLGIKIVVEGVETSEQIKILKQLEIEFVQGYFYSKPLQYNDFILFIEEHS